MTVKILNSKAFAKRLEQISKNLKVSVGETVTHVAFDIFKGVADKTPVDTGFARASWNISQVTPSGRTPDPAGFAKGDRNAGAAAAGSRNSAQLGAFRFDDSKKPIVWVANNVPYIVDIEARHPTGKALIQRTVTAVNKKYIGIAKILK